MPKFAWDENAKILVKKKLKLPNENENKFGNERKLEKILK